MQQLCSYFTLFVHVPLKWSLKLQNALLYFHLVFVLCICICICPAYLSCICPAYLETQSLLGVRPSKPRLSWSVGSVQVCCSSKCQSRPALHWGCTHFLCSLALVVSIFLLLWLSLVTFFHCEIGDGEVGDVGGEDGGGEEDPSSGGRAHCRRK